MNGPFGYNSAMSDISFYNSLGRKKEKFETLEPNVAKIYSCGPTVYDRQHIGNLGAVVFADTLRRMLEWNGYTVKQVINITDFGHLVSDADDGDDKMSKGLRREGKEFTMENMLGLGKKYADIYFEDARALGVDTESITFPFASQYVKEQIELIKKLEEKGLAYIIPYTNEPEGAREYRGTGGVYFDTSKFEGYGKLGDIDLEGLREGARVSATNEKRRATDFVLWKSNPDMGWESPWGKGFPGWHIECSAMIFATLGEQIDIHTGGPEHIAIHHNNEIAQSEGASGKHPFSRFWLHRAWIKIDDEKISKSLGNTYYVSNLEERGYHPLSYRYWLLTAHYRTPTNFTWDALAASQSALLQLVQRAHQLKEIESDTEENKYIESFRTYINDDLDTPRAISVIWNALKDTSLTPQALKALLVNVDYVLGLELFFPDREMHDLMKKEFGEEVSMSDLPAELQLLITQREEARANKDWAKADELRDLLKASDIEVLDSEAGSKIIRK